MIIKSTEKNGNQATIVVEIDKELMESGVNAAYMKARKSIMIPGFRKGKAPRKMIESMYGAHVFYEDGLEEIFPKVYDFAIAGQDFKAIGRPTLKDMDINDENVVTLTLVTDVYPEVTLGQYKGLEVEKAEPVVTDAQVQAELDRMAENVSSTETADRPAEMGDTVNIDFEGFDNGVPFEGGKGENHDLKLGSGSFVPGFEEQLVGMSAGEEKDIDITFPEDYHKDLAGKAVVFHVKVHEVKEKEVPAMDDEFAKDVSEFDTLKELKADLKKKITEERQKDADRVFEENLVNQVAENITADVPDAMVESQAHQYLENFKAQISRQFSYEDYKKMTGMDDAKLLEEAKEPALRQVKMDLATAAIIKAENIEASDEDVEAEFAKMAEQFGMDVEMVKKYLSKEQVHDQILTQKAVAVVVDSATAEKPAKKTAKKAETAEGEEKKPAKKTTKKAETAEGEEKPKKAPAKKAAKKEEKEAE